MSRLSRVVRGGDIWQEGANKTGGKEVSGGHINYCV